MVELLVLHDEWRRPFSQHSLRQALLRKNLNLEFINGGMSLFSVPQMWLSKH